MNTEVCRPGGVVRHNRAALIFTFIALFATAIVSLFALTDLAHSAILAFEVGSIPAE
jgi:hypothetical protein